MVDVELEEITDALESFNSEVVAYLALSDFWTGGRIRKTAKSW